MKEPLNTDKFVKNLMESMYGKDSMGDIDVPEAPNNDEIVVQHAKQLGDDFGLPKDLGNAWKAPGKVEETLTGDQAKLDVNGNGKIEGEDLKNLRAGKKKKEEVMESRVEALEESLKTLLESLQTLISEGYGGKKMMKEDETTAPKKKKKKTDFAPNVSMNKGKKFIEKRETLDKEPETVNVQGHDANVKKVISNLDPNHPRAQEIKMKATAQKLDDKKPRQKGQALSKREIAQLTQDANAEKE